MAQIRSELSRREIRFSRSARKDILLRLLQLSDSRLPHSPPTPNQQQQADGFSPELLRSPGGIDQPDPPLPGFRSPSPAQLSPGAALLSMASPVPPPLPVVPPARPANTHRQPRALPPAPAVSFNVPSADVSLQASLPNRGAELPLPLATASLFPPYHHPLPPTRTAFEPTPHPPPAPARLAYPFPPYPRAMPPPPNPVPASFDAFPPPSAEAPAISPGFPLQPAVPSAFRLPAYTLASATPLPPPPHAPVHEPLPVSPSLRQQILSGTDVDLSSLLSVFSEPNVSRDVDCGPLTLTLKTTGPASRILSFPEFALAFSRYTEVVCSIFPHRRRELNNYFNIIAGLAVSYGGTHFYTYHRLLSAKCAARVGLWNQCPYWGVLDLELHNCVFLGCRPVVCAICCCPDHSSSHCPFVEGNSNNHKTAAAKSSSSVPRLPQSAGSVDQSTFPRQQVCFRFNNSKGISAMPSTSFMCKNLLSVVNDPETVNDLLAAEVTLGFMMSHFPAPPFPTFRINPIGCLKDLELCRLFLNQWNDLSMFYDDHALSPEDLQLYTDAAPSVGFGGYFAGQWFASAWPRKMLHLPPSAASSAVYEVYPVVVAALLWGSSWSGKRVLIYCDNEAAVFAINKGRSRAPVICPFLRRLVWTAACHQFILTAAHIPGHQNAIADSLSRFAFQRFRTLAPDADPDPTPVPSFSDTIFL
ncbi:hypothetical protein ACEWY4_023576 [Coilia grayii]|uniref:RNase H type-1 domain-containing protein n=1 Tax=Coilia grayii TaxID=363190 RepID=A0ABD1J701_9TELE